MGEVVRNVFVWVEPVVALVIGGVAWRRYRSRGSGLVLAGFAMMFLAPLIRLGLRTWRNPSDAPTVREFANELVILSIATSIVASLGIAVVIYGMHHLIGSASNQRSQLNEDQESPT